MSDEDTETTPPIVVRESAAQDVANSTLRTVITAGLAVGASQVVKSEAAMVAVVAAGALIAGSVASYLVGIHRLLQQHRKLRFLAKQVPDSVAVLKGKGDA